MNNKPVALITNVKISTENCSFTEHYSVLEIADSAVNIELYFPRIISRQSKSAIQQELVTSIKKELSKFRWLVIGHVQLDLTWYLNAVERQETDKVGDLDNITKPIIDALSGTDGLLVDDSQIRGLYTSWLSKNELIAENILKLRLRFNNDYVLGKKNLFFIQYKEAICIPVNIDFTNIEDILSAKILLHARKRARKTAYKIKQLGGNADRYLVCSEYDFHRTRLNTFSSSQILTKQEFNKKCIAGGLQLKHLLHFLRRTKKIKE